MERGGGVQHEAHSAELSAAGDCLQRPLRSRFRQQLRPGVRLPNKEHP
jgi:hypothetical protein